MTDQSFLTIKTIPEHNDLFHPSWISSPWWLDCIHRLLGDNKRDTIVGFEHVYTSSHTSFALKVLKRYVKWCEEGQVVKVTEYAKNYVMAREEGNRDTVMALRILSHAAERGHAVMVDIPRFTQFDRVGFIGGRGSVEFIRLHVNYYRLSVLRERLDEEAFFDSFMVDDKSLFKAFLLTRHDRRYYVWMLDNVENVVEEMMEMLLSDHADLFLMFLLHALRTFDLRDHADAHQELYNKLSRHSSHLPYNPSCLLVRLQQALHH